MKKAKLDRLATSPCSSILKGCIGAYGLAMKDGWKDTARDGRRVFFGPCCSGKKDQT